MAAKIELAKRLAKLTGTQCAAFMAQTGAPRAPDTGKPLQRGKRLFLAFQKHCVKKQTRRALIDAFLRRFNPHVSFSSIPSGERFLGFPAHSLNEMDVRRRNYFSVGSAAVQTICLLSVMALSGNRCFSDLHGDEFLKFVWFSNPNDKDTYGLNEMGPVTEFLAKCQEPVILLQLRLIEPETALGHVIRSTRPNWTPIYAPFSETDPNSI